MDNPLMFRITLHRFKFGDCEDLYESNFYFLIDFLPNFN